MQITHEDQMASIAKYRELRKLYSKEFADLDSDPEAAPSTSWKCTARRSVPRRESADYPEPVELPEFELVKSRTLRPAPTQPRRQFATAQNGVVGSRWRARRQDVDLRWIPAGDFEYGSNDESPAEYPKRRVRIERGFWIGATEITNEQYALFNPSHDSRYVDELTKDHAREGIPANLPKQPVSRVGHDAAERFCDWLEETLTSTGALPDGYEVRLPTEIEWEYAARAGSSDAFWYGGVETDFANYANLADKSLSKMRVGQGAVDYWRKAQVDDGMIAIGNVASYEPNAFGLYDMIGNVAEWTSSPMTAYGAESGSVQTTDKPGDLERADRVVRGGLERLAKRATSSFRVGVTPYFQAADVGFRVVIAPKAE